METIRSIGFVIYTFLVSYLLFGAGIDYSVMNWWNVPLALFLVLGWVGYLSVILSDYLG